MKIQFTIKFLACLAFLFAFYGCNSFESQLEGDWRLEDLLLSFSEGEIMMKDTWTLFGTYEILDREENVIRFAGSISELEYIASVEFLDGLMDWYVELDNQRHKLWTFTRP